jgi:hypothetical protein
MRSLARFPVIPASEANEESTMSIRLAACLTLALPLGACTSFQLAETGEDVPASALVPYEQWPAEFAGNTVLIETEGGWVNAVNLAPDGTMTIVPELAAAAIKGQWGTRGEALCVSYEPRGEECWPYKSVLAANGDWVRLQSDRDQVLNVRLLSEDEEALVERGG